MNWTREQREAIDRRNANILVAAAAGSGKTAVLVERIKKLIIEDGVSIDRMLIVTFTNAAAAEMKEKIRAALYKEIEADPENSEKLRQQLNLLPRANISTFHAFALDVIRRFFYTADIEPSFSICDDAQRTILKEDAMDLLLESSFAEGSEAFYDFLGWYSDERNLNQIRELLDSAYNVLQSLPYPWQWLDEKIEALKLSPGEFAASPLMEQLWAYVGQALAEALEREEQAVGVLEEAGLDRLADKLRQEELPAYQAMIQAAGGQDFDQTRAAICSLSSVRLSAKKEEKEDYEPVKPLVSALRKRASAAVSDLKKLCFGEELSDQVLELNQTAPKAETLRRLLLDFDQIFADAKAERRLVDFNDIEHFCLEILESPDAAVYYRNKFQYIFIDEYQDTNILQEEIISRIKREDNLFMVGDIKQSIYKFRLAEPEIFRRKYEAYGADMDKSVKIDLNRNFRSKGPILDEINLIFGDLMEGYDAQAMLYKGVEYDGPHLYTPALRVVDMASVDDADEELAALRSAEIEALQVCRLIRENLGRTFFDHKMGCERTLRLSDIVVLMRGVKNYADIFVNALKESGIESFVDDSDGYFDTIEIEVFMNLLSVIDNKMQDVPLISVLHSEIFGFSAEELGRVRAACREGSYAEAFMTCASKGFPSGAASASGAAALDDGSERAEAAASDGAAADPLAEKCAAALSDLRRWKETAASMPLGKFIWSLLLETGYYLQMGTQPNGSQRQANLRALVDKAEAYSQTRQGSLYSFVRYIDAVKTRKVPMGQVKLVGENDDLVRIMTIHKSKGLEFPMVIVSGLGRRLNYTKMGRGVTLHKDLGLGMTLADFEGHWYKQTLLQRLIGKQIHREEYQEEIRILYVALTRAKDLLYLTGCVRDGAKFMENRDTGLIGDSCYLDMIGQVSDFQMVDANLLSPAGARRGQRCGNPMDWDIYDGEPSPEKQREILRRLDFVYPYEKSRTLKSKYSVTELNREGTQTAEITLAVPKFRQGEKKLTAAERGTVYHGLMERIDFGRACREGLPYIQQAAAEMAEREIFTQEELAAVDLSRLADFFRSGLGMRCAEAFDGGRLHRERPFNLLQELEGETIVVQGVIDCFFEEEGRLVLLDYKTNWIDLSKPFEQEAERLRGSYGKQIEIYRQALTAAAGLPVGEAYLYLFDIGREIKMQED